MKSLVNTGHMFEIKSHQLNNDSLNDYPVFENMNSVYISCTYNIDSEMSEVFQHEILGVCTVKAKSGP